MKTGKPKTRAGFSSTYDELLNSISASEVFHFFFGLILFFSVLGLSVRLGKSSSSANIQIDVQNLSLAILVFFSILGIFFGFIFGIITNLLGMIQRPKVLIARIIIAIDHPFNKRFGLAHTDIERLKEVGKIEQSSAGWKNGFLSLALIWFLLDNTELMSTQLNNLVLYVEKIQESNSTTLASFGWSIFWLLVSLLSGLVANVFYHIIYDFLGYEPVNRGILKACIDAQSLLQAKNLERKSSLTIKDKQLVASTYGYFYVPSSQKTQFRFRASYKTIEKGGREYLLLMSVKPSTKTE